MPELPEVETVKRQLTSHILNKQISQINLSGYSLRYPISDLNPMIGLQFTDIYRRNKYLIIDIPDYWFVVHLGMTGQLIFSKEHIEKNHIHMRLFFSNGEQLVYQDARRFGCLLLFDKATYSNYNDIPLLKKLGIEPLDKSFNWKSFTKVIEGKKISAKKFIMDSHYICGIGNIYANEILFLSKINPYELMNNLSENQKKALFKNIPLVLNRALELGGSSISDFVHVNGESGKMQNFYKVYAKDKEACSDCGHVIIRKNQHGRSTFYCDNCQPLNK